MMTHGYHALPVSKGHDRPTTAISIAFVATPIAVILAAILWSTLSAHSESLARRAAIAEVRTAIDPGMSRADAYAIVRAHGLVAFNPALAAWTKNRLGVWYRSDDGAWPRPNDPRPTMGEARPLNPAHPEVEIRLTTAPRGGCGTATIERIMFDRYDRVKNIAFSVPYWTCQ
jgi:hypothetical protein